jgi:adenosylcobinamide kinase/adenosylcobinamide-phosphate guanylyltransferase
MVQAGKQIILITGASRSGKSRYAQIWAENKAPSRLFLATARALDEEMADRIRRHKEVRGEGWSTIEEPLMISPAIREYGSRAEVILLDCVTLWVSNLLMEGLSDKEILSSAEDLARAASEVSCSIAMVTNEVGWGIVPEYPEGRRFRDLAGSVNQVLARSADQVILMVAGIPMLVK